MQSFPAYCQPDLALEPVKCGDCRAVVLVTSVQTMNKTMSARKTSTNTSPKMPTRDIRKIHWAFLLNMLIKVLRFQVFNSLTSACTGYLGRLP
jgi:hypothetical protein